MMRTRGFIFSVLALVMAINAGAQTRIIPRDRIESLANPRLSSDSSSLDFEVRSIVAERMNEDDAPRNFAFRFKNTSDRTISVERITTTCSCVNAICNRTEVRPHEVAEITARYNPKGHPGRFERRIFVYTDNDSEPAAVLKLSVEVSTGNDLSADWPFQKGGIRLRRGSVEFVEGVKAVEKIRFINLTGKDLRLQCEESFLPPCLSFRSMPEMVKDGQTGEMVISYDPTKQSRSSMKIMLKGLGVPPSQSAIEVKMNK